MIEDLRTYSDTRDEYLGALLNAAADEIIRLRQVVETYDAVLQDRLSD